MLHRHALILQRGDPGLFDVLKRFGRAATGFARGGVTGAVAGFLSPAQRARASLQALTPLGSIPIGLSSPVPVVRTPGVRGALERFIPGGATGLQVGAVAPAGGCPSGYHPNKSSYMTAAGMVAKGSRCVRNRRRNLSNGRANSRALRRLSAWDKQERKRIGVLRRIARK